MQSLTISQKNEKPMLRDIFAQRVKLGGSAHDTVSPRVFVALLNKGVDGQVLTALVKHIPKPLVVKTLGSDPSNFSKLVRRKHLSKNQTDDLNDLTKLWVELRHFFNDDEGMIREWISEPLPIFDGMSADELMTSQYGRDLVRDRLDEMRYGEFA